MKEPCPLKQIKCTSDLDIKQKFITLQRKKHKGLKSINIIGKTKRIKAICIAVYAGQYYNGMWMGHNRSSIQNEQNGNDNLPIKAIQHSHSVRNQCICLFPMDLLPSFQQFIPEFGKG